MEVSMIKSIKISFLAILMLPGALQAGIWDNVARFFQSPTIKEKAIEFAGTTAFNAATIATSKMVNASVITEAIGESCDYGLQDLAPSLESNSENLSMESCSINWKIKTGVALVAIAGTYLYSKNGCMIYLQFWPIKKAPCQPMRDKRTSIGSNG